MGGVIGKDGRMVVGPRAEMEAKLLKEINKNKKSYKDKTAIHKASGGNVAKYYNTGGRVTGCGPSQNKP